MLTSAVVSRVRQILGTPTNANHLHAAVRCGYVRPVGRYPDGWRRFDETAVEGLTRYMREKSRTHRRSASGSHAEAVA